MCLGFMSFRALPTALKQKNKHNSTNIQPIITLFQSRIKFVKRHIFKNFFQNNWKCFVFVIDMLHFTCFLFFINFQRHMHSICVWNLIKQSKYFQTRHETAYIYDGYYIRTYVYLVLFSVKKCVFELSRVWPWRWPLAGTLYYNFRLISRSVLHEICNIIPFNSTEGWIYNGLSMQNARPYRS